MNFKNIYSIEANSQLVDKLGRIRSYSKFQNYFSADVSKEIYQRGFRPVYKYGKKHAIILSHDVDYIYAQTNIKSFLKTSVKNILRSDFIKIYDEFRNLITRTPYKEWSLKKFIDFEKKHKIPATYFFLCLEKGEIDFNYKIDELKDLIDELKCNGSEIAFHGGLEAFDNSEILNRELTRFRKSLNISPSGYRSHFLKYNLSKTPTLLKENGFMYDATLGLPDILGFRNGMCYPFRPMLKDSQDFEDILELPLHVMDVTFFKYMNLSLEDSHRLFREIWTEVKKINGVLSILWHNNNLNDDYAILYDKIMTDIIEDDEAWICTHKECSEFWLENNLSTMEEYLRQIF